MRHALVVLALVLSTAFAPSALAHSQSRSHHSSRSHSSKSHSSKSKPVHVRGYYRKNGTYVAPYSRSLPGTAEPHESVGRYRRGYIAEGYNPHSSVRLDRHGRIKRSKAARSAFERQNPCPSTGRNRGACPGYVVDHVKPLECGGADAPSNMQWQTVADGKMKDKTEGNCRQ